MSESIELKELLYQRSKEGTKSLALLIDPEKMDRHDYWLIQAEKYAAFPLDYFFVGGSLVNPEKLAICIKKLKQVNESGVPVVLFPGSAMQVSEEADAILFLSLISGRNPELLIGQHVLAAPALFRSGLEILPTGYMLVNGGRPTSVEYISQTIPIPRDKEDLAVATALAGKFLGLSLFYLDAGSGAHLPVPPEMIRAVRKSTGSPLIVGGGINSLSKAQNAWEAGADLVVIGNGAEKNPGLIAEVFHFLRCYNASLNVN
ncbi:geranylgeranylglyceryl/heptaprenylglyceryl phosphate synthase [Cyclobacterium roseum]|uniref:geranylgeranylglyceryl/heptaprenylglyceryl phosphate synthase n=1 Tax=Cyclobacterium roseum TaxID=2666137 RepID=UPI001390A47F|nr:geranylgeranylglyceryl/heptaprenylglyceryl phosphate synthase [Cyclobacterium roseum]